jgi:serine/threonine protein kinase
MSPRTCLAVEQTLATITAPQSDVWALGVILHELLFGRRPARSLQQLPAADEGGG